jgi:hypothetical protein
MIPMSEFAAYFVVASAVTAAVNSIAYGGQPRKIAWESLRFFLMIVLGILVFSVLVYCLELIFLPK